MSIAQTTDETRENTANLDPIPFERRSCTREDARGVLTASLASEAGGGMVSRVELVDISDSGVGFICPMKAPIGSHVQLDGGVHFTMFAGNVARCEPVLGGYLIGLTREMRMAA